MRCETTETIRFLTKVAARPIVETRRKIYLHLHHLLLHPRHVLDSTTATSPVKSPTSVNVPDILSRRILPLKKKNQRCPSNNTHSYAIHQTSSISSNQVHSPPPSITSCPLRTLGRLLSLPNKWQTVCSIINMWIIINMWT